MLKRIPCKLPEPIWRVVREPMEGELDRLIVIGRRNDPTLESFVLKLRE